MPETIGLTNVTLSIDPTDTHGDVNRDNNDYIFSFDVFERPDEVDVRVRPESISTNPRIPSSGDPFEVIAKIENVGQVASANVTIYLEEFLEGAGWQEVADSQYEIKTVAGSTVSTAYEVYKSAVPAGTGVVREFRITALSADVSFIVFPRYSTSIPIRKWLLATWAVFYQVTLFACPVIAKK